MKHSYPQQNNNVPLPEFRKWFLKMQLKKETYPFLQLVPHLADCLSWLKWKSTVINHACFWPWWRLCSVFAVCMWLYFQCAQEHSKSTNIIRCFSLWPCRPGEFIGCMLHLHNCLFPMFARLRWNSRIGFLVCKKQLSRHSLRTSNAGSCTCIMMEVQLKRASMQFSHKYSQAQAISDTMVKTCFL